jgi:hypothetical protein
MTRTHLSGLRRLKQVEELFWLSSEMLLLGLARKFACNCSAPVHNFTLSPSTNLAI